MKPLAFIVHTRELSVARLAQLLEAKGIATHLIQSVDEAERACAVFPPQQVKFALIDATMCQGQAWDRWVAKLTANAPELVLARYPAHNLNDLFLLLGPQYSQNGESRAVNGFKEPAMIGETQQFHDLLDLAQRYAAHDITVLITGETGTGKEVMAQYIHAKGPRAAKPFVACNMTAIPETLVESELFGYVKGAFTGADRNKKGLIEAAEGGTLFLDEIGDLAPAIQAKLLRFLETREYYKVGDATPKQSDVRILAATNKDLDEAMQGPSFRKDLYFRLNSARLILPSLRERKEDIILLVANFVYAACQQLQKPLKKISSSVKALFLEYTWPGNIRELKSVIESAVMVSDGDYVALNDLPMHLQQYATRHKEQIASNAIRNIEQGEKMVIEDALRQTNGDKAKAASALGISTRTLYRKIEKFSLAGS